MIYGLFGSFGPFHVAALASEAITRLPATRAIGGGAGAMFAAAVGSATALIFAAGSYLIVTRRARSLEPFRRAVPRHSGTLGRRHRLSR